MALESDDSMSLVIERTMDEPDEDERYEEEFKMRNKKKAHLCAFTFADMANHSVTLLLRMPH